MRRLPVTPLPYLSTASAAAARHDIGHTCRRGEALVVVVVAAEDERHPVLLEDRYPEPVDIRCRPVQPARPGRLMEDDDPERRPRLGQLGVEPAGLGSVG